MIFILSSHTPWASRMPEWSLCNTASSRSASASCVHPLSTNFLVTLLPIARPKVLSAKRPHPRCCRCFGARYLLLLRQSERCLQNWTCSLISNLGCLSMSSLYSGSELFTALSRLCSSVARVPLGAGLDAVRSVMERWHCVVLPSFS